MAILQVRADFRLAYFPVSIPSRPQAAMAADRTVPPHVDFPLIPFINKSGSRRLQPAPNNFYHREWPQKDHECLA
jgi:hypothetical protein